MIIGGREISVRQKDKHGGIRSDLKKPLEDPSGRPLVIILIHGFNNNYNQAQDSYEKFQKEFARIGVPKSYVESVWEFYWPGDGIELGVAAASYAFQIPKAQAAAKQLSDYLSEICQPGSTTESSSLDIQWDVGFYLRLLSCLENGLVTLSLQD